MIYIPTRHAGCIGGSLLDSVGNSYDIFSKMHYPFLVNTTIPFERDLHLYMRTLSNYVAA